MAFLSLLDDRAKPKGSRDPLGFELVWTHFGRRVIGNLTTVTSSLNNFAVALLGFRWANELHYDKPPSAKAARVRESFLRYEQLSGYLRYLAGDTVLMGVTRVSRRMSDPKAKVSLGLGAEQQILSDQASYGLWGLYATAMKETGLITSEERRPTSLGDSIALAMESKLNKSEYIRLMTGKKNIRREQLMEQANPFLSAIQRKAIRNNLIHPLMNGNDKHLVQHELWQVTQQLAEKDQLPNNTGKYITQLQRRTRNPDLKHRLAEIHQVERILVAANNLFRYCQRKDGEALNDVLHTVDRRYDYSHLSKDLDLTTVPHGSALSLIRHALLENDTQTALLHILDLNKSVMEQRGGAPWVEIEQGNTLRVRMPNEMAELRSQKQLETSWDYDYFLLSFLKIAMSTLGPKWTAA